MIPKKNTISDIENEFQAISRGVSGDRLIIDAQSYLRIMDFPIGNFGPNRNGVDGMFGEATRAALVMFQIMEKIESPVKTIDSRVMTQLEQAVFTGSTVRSLAKSLELNEIQSQISQESTKAEFINIIYYYSIIDETDSKVPAAVTTAQATLETGYGKFIPVDISSGQFSYNLFGIKGTGPAGSVTAWTYEEDRKTKIWEPVRSHFRAYHGYKESVKDHSRLFYDNLTRYGAAFQTKTPADFAKAIAKAGYATDSNYAKKIIYFMGYWGLT